MVKPLSEMETVRLSSCLGVESADAATPAPVVGDDTFTSPSAAAKVVVASMNMMTLVTMSRYGTRLSSPPSSAISSPCSRIFRSFVRSRWGVIRRSAPSARRRGVLRLGEEVLQLHRECLQLVLLLFRRRVQEHVADHA